MAAWNVLYDRPAISACGLAVAPPVPGGHTYFAVPWNGRLLVGTGQSPWPRSSSAVSISAPQVLAFTRDINRALPGMDLQPDEVLDVFPGLQSAKREGGREFSKRNVFVDHASHQGPQGLFSIAGIKFTTSRRVAEQALNRIFPARRHTLRPGETGFYAPPGDIAAPEMLFPYDWHPRLENPAWLDPLRQNLASEAVRHLEDLMVRRTNLGDNPPRALELAPAAASLFDGGAPERRLEIERLHAHFASRKPASMHLEGHRPATSAP
jgi:glycerol-3-phosphate dehydrogenase